MRQRLAGAITCSYTYDAMNRVLTRSYESDPAQTPLVDYKYDGAGTIGVQNALGKLTAVNTSGTFVSSYTYDNFDAMGRVLHSTQVPPLQAWLPNRQWHDGQAREFLC